MLSFKARFRLIMENPQPWPTHLRSHLLSRSNQSSGFVFNLNNHLARPKVSTASPIQSYKKRDFLERSNYNLMIFIIHSPAQSGTARLFKLVEIFQCQNKAEAKKFILIVSIDGNFRSCSNNNSIEDFERFYEMRAKSLMIIRNYSC